ncbi:extracellular solute-binding protein [uncultured Amnibacterium sp.]|uniref:extracellular solute-binding protein n=1 Tax=uncultured Amnibacterium sp. TaxID=1631851 RepID=UPI0035CCA3F4
MTITRKLIALAATATVVGALAACSPSGSSSAPGGASAPGPSALTSAKGEVDVSIWHAFGGPNGAAFQKLVDQFNSENTGKVHVTATFQGLYPDLLAKYTAALRNTSAPTILVLNDVSSGILADLEQSVPAAEMAKANPGDLQLTDIRRAPRNYYTLGGVQYAVPMASSTPVLWVNRDLLQDAGVSDSADLSTVDAVVAAARQVKQKTGKFGFTIQDDDWTIENWTATAGQDFCSPGNGRTGKAPTAITINTGGAKTAISKIVDLYRDKVAVDGGVDGAAAIAAFSAGKVAFMPYGSGALGALKAGGATFQYEALPFPASDAKFRGNTTIGGAAMWLSDSATDAAKVAGWKLETFLTSAASQEQWSHATGYVPVNQEVDSSATQATFLDQNPSFRTFIEQIDGSPIASNTAGCLSGAMAAIRAGNVSQLQAAFAGTKTADAALDAAAASAKKALSDYQEQAGK